MHLALSAIFCNFPCKLNTAKDIPFADELRLTSLPVNRQATFMESFMESLHADILMHNKRLTMKKCSLHAFKWMHYLITSCISNFSLKLINYLIHHRKEQVKREKEKALEDFRELLEGSRNWGGKYTGLVHRDDRTTQQKPSILSRLKQAKK